MSYFINKTCLTCFNLHLARHQNIHRDDNHELCHIFSFHNHELIVEMLKMPHSTIIILVFFMCCFTMLLSCHSVAKSCILDISQKGMCNINALPVYIFSLPFYWLQRGEANAVSCNMSAKKVLMFSCCMFQQI